MTRPNVAHEGPLPPDQWPSWVLAFGKGYFPDDPVRQAERVAEFHAWQEASAAWFAEQGIPKSPRACNDEQRRRRLRAEVPARE